MIYLRNFKSSVYAAAIFLLVCFDANAFSGDQKNGK